MVISVEDLSASVWLWHRDGNRWAVQKVITIPAEPADADDLPQRLQPFGAVPPLVSDIDLSVDDRWLYVSCWGTGELKQFDVSDPFHPRETASVHLGGVVRREPHPAAPNMALAGGPQMIEISRDGKRVYATNSLYASWDEVFYPDGVGAWMAKLDADTSAGGGFPTRASSRTATSSAACACTRVRLQGGDGPATPTASRTRFRRNGIPAGRHSNFSCAVNSRRGALVFAHPDGELVGPHEMAFRATDLDGGLGAAVFVS